MLEKLIGLGLVTNILQTSLEKHGIVWYTRDPTKRFRGTRSLVEISERLIGDRKPIIIHTKVFIVKTPIKQDAMKHVREFMKGKRLLRPPAVVYPGNNQPNTSNCSGGFGVFPGIGLLLVRESLNTRDRRGLLSCIPHEDHCFLVSLKSLSY